MPLIDGEKYACQSCVKGHRVSGCNHTDRELQHINPKGRPVKQCEHCRGARKSKSHHAKCDCGDKKDKDIAKEKSVSNACCCHSGTKCICGVKKEPSDLRLDTSKQTLHDVRARPKVVATHSENNLTVFANGHHRPCHRNNNSAHISGVPYKIPRPHTLHGHSAFAAFTQGNSYDQADAPPATRSMDTLSLSNNEFYQMFGSTSQTDGLSLTPLSGNLDTNCFQDPLFTGRSSAFGTGTHSPTESHLSETTGGSQWPWTNDIASVSRNLAYGSLSTSPSQDCLTNGLPNDWPISSADLDEALANHTWSAGDLPLDASKLGESLVQPISHSGESKQSAPGLSASSSSPSELGEPILFGDFAPQSIASETLFWEDAPAFRPAPTHLNDNRGPTSVPELQDLDINFPKTFNPVAATMATSGANTYSEPQSISIPNTLDDVTSDDPWLVDQSNNTAFAGYADAFNSSEFPDWL